MKKLKLLLPILLLASCTGKKKSDATPPPLFPQPQTVVVNTNGGYTTNIVTGDTIQPIILESGDTLKTGVAVPATPKVIHPDSIKTPKVVKVSKKLTTKNAHPNQHKIPDKLITIPINKHSLKVIAVPKIAKNDTSHYIINSTGDTIPTGIFIPAKCKTLPKGEGKGVAIQPQPTKSMPPTTKDAAITNLQYLDVDQGMNSSYVRSILEDKSGNLWFGTDGGGVSKYNGETTKLQNLKRLS